MLKLWLKVCSQTTCDIVTSQSAGTFGGMFTLKTKTMTMIGGILTDAMAIFG